jgi:DNA-binding NarL/FixJ family response regulator
MPRIRVFHCDDSPAFTRLVRHWLDEHDDEVEHVGAAHTPSEALDELATTQPDVVLLDTMGSPGDGALLTRIRETAPEARVIVYSGYLSIVDADELGGDADAYLEKGDDDRQLVAMISAVIDHNSRT